MNTEYMDQYITNCVFIQEIHGIARFYITSNIEINTDIYTIDNFFMGKKVKTEYSENQYKYIYANLIYYDSCNELLWQNPLNGQIEPPLRNNHIINNIHHNTTSNLWIIPSQLIFLPKNDIIYNTYDSEYKENIYTLSALKKLIECIFTNKIVITSYNKYEFIGQITNNICTQYELNLYSENTIKKEIRVNMINNEILQQYIKYLYMNYCDCIRISLNLNIQIYDIVNNKLVIKIKHDFINRISLIYLRYNKNMNA